MFEPINVTQGQNAIAVGAALPIIALFGWRWLAYRRKGIAHTERAFFALGVVTAAVAAGLRPAWFGVVIAIEHWWGFDHPAALWMRAHQEIPTATAWLVVIGYAMHYVPVLLPRVEERQSLRRLVIAYFLMGLYIAVIWFLGASFGAPSGISR